MLEYALGGLSNNISASTYTYYIPDKEQLISEVEKLLKENDNKYNFIAYNHNGSTSGTNMN